MDWSGFARKQLGSRFRISRTGASRPRLINQRTSDSGSAYVSKILILNLCETLKPPQPALIPIHQKITGRWVFRHGDGMQGSASRKKAEVMQTHPEICTGKTVIEAVFEPFTIVMHLLPRV